MGRPPRKDHPLTNLPMHVHLNHAEISILNQPDTPKSGGFQGLIKKLRTQLDATGALSLTGSDLERINRYARYTTGGWQGRIKSIFSRTLGPNLGR